MTQQRKAKNKAVARSSTKVAWTADAWEDYLYWQQHDAKLVGEINGLIHEILRDPFKGTGKPEPLKGDLSGFWSRRVTKVDRLVYMVEDGVLCIVQARYHY